MRLIKRIRRAILGYEMSSRIDRAGDIDALEQEQKSLQGKLARLNDVLVEAGRNEMALWLYANRSERMDANVCFFEASRREFHLSRYGFAAAYVEGKAVADIACGTGYGCAHLKQEGRAKSVVGVDIDAEAIKYAGNTYGDEYVTFRQASGHDSGLETAGFDVITSFETIEHLHDDVALLGEFSRVLRRGGTLVISTPNQWPCKTHPHHVREYDRKSFEAVLSAHFEVLELHNQNSGSSSPFNREQAAGIVATTDDNQNLAECFIAVCRKC